MRYFKPKLLPICSVSGHGLHSSFPGYSSTIALAHPKTPQELEKIIPGSTLLFLDEIQECPDAIRYLRYFKEEMPELHVIAAGSLLEFTLEKLGVAVGRVDYLFLYPLSFMEFLTANQRDDLRENIECENIDPATHESILDYLRNYMWLGGMPAVIDTWLKHKDSSLCQRIQDRIIKTYIDDFQKYARAHQVEHVGHVFSSIPKQLGKKFKYISVDPDVKTYPIKQALWLYHLTRIRVFAARSGFSLVKQEKFTLTLERQKGKQTQHRKIMLNHPKTPQELEKKLLEAMQNETGR